MHDNILVNNRLHIQKWSIKIITAEKVLLLVMWQCLKTAIGQDIAHVFVVTLVQTNPRTHSYIDLDVLVHEDQGCVCDWFVQSLHCIQTLLGVVYKSKHEV